MKERQKAALEAKLQPLMPPGCTVRTAWKSWQPRILTVYMNGRLGYTPPTLPSYMDNVKLHPVATAWELDEHGEIERTHLLELAKPTFLKVAQVRQWLKQHNLDIAVVKRGGNYVFMKHGQSVAQYQIKETTPAQLDEMKSELDAMEASRPRYDESVALADNEAVWAGYTYLVSGRPIQAPRTMTVGEWQKCCPPGSIICKCDVFARGLVENPHDSLEDEE